jgi:hypothetical protein
VDGIDDIDGGFMSGQIIYTPATGADWATAWEQAEYTRKGKHGIGLTNMDGTGLPAIESGSWAEVAGSIYKWTQAEAISGSPTAGLINFIALEPSGSGDTAIVTAKWTISTPAWSNAYQGWYWSTTRYVMRCFYTGSEYIDKQVVPCEKGSVIRYNIAPQNYKTDYTRMVPFAYDFYQENVDGAWDIGGAVMASGGVSPGTGTANHPGIARVNSGTVTMGGYQFYSDIVALALAGGEITEFIFRVPETTDTYLRLGFHDSYTTSTPDDGSYIYVVGTSLDGRSFNSTSPTITGTSYTITANVWYRGRVIINSDATRADFYLYDESCALLWHDANITNIPSGRSLGIFCQAYNSGTTDRNIFDLDYFAFWCNRILTR